MNMIGQRFGRLVVIGRAENQGRRHCWLCYCDCDSRKITFNGQILSLPDWAEHFGITHQLLRNRIYKGWSFKEAVTNSPRLKPGASQEKAPSPLTLEGAVRALE